VYARAAPDLLTEQASRVWREWQMTGSTPGD